VVRLEGLDVAVELLFLGDRQAVGVLRIEIAGDQVQAVNLGLQDNVA